MHLFQICDYLLLLQLVKKPMLSLNFRATRFSLYLKFNLKRLNKSNLFISILQLILQLRLCYTLVNNIK